MLRDRGMLSHKTAEKGNVMYPQSVPIGIEWKCGGMGWDYASWPSTT